MATNARSLLPALSVPHRIKVHHLKSEATKYRLEQVLDRQLSESSVRPLGRVASGERTVGEDQRLYYSFQVFEFDHAPAFAAGHLQEERYGFLLLVGWKSWLGAVHSGFTWSLSRIEKMADPLAYDVLRRFLGMRSRAYQRLGVTNLSIGEGVVHNQTLEALDLQGILPTLGAGRQVVRNTRVRDRDRRLWSVTLGTGRLSESRPRSGLDEYVEWCAAVFALLEQAKRWSGGGFIYSFATPWNLDELDPQIHPTGLLLRLGALREELEAGIVNLELTSRRSGLQPRMLAQVTALHLVRRLSESMAVERTGAHERVLHPTWGEVARLKPRTRRYHVSGLAGRVRVCETVGCGGQGLAAWLADRGAVHIVYSDVRFAYIDGQLFSDEGIRSQLPTLAATLKGKRQLANLESEKGHARKRVLKNQLLPGAKQFPQGSVFHAIENHLANAEDYLICDDQREDEWADYIGVTLQPPTLTLYHGKASSGQAGASTFHEVCGQALKNLGRLLVTEDELQSKLPIWNSNWDTVTNPATKIPRIRRAPSGATAASCVQAILKVMAEPGARRRVIVVHSGLSRKAIAKKIAKAGGSLSTSPQPARGRPAAEKETAQLVWILAGYVSACRELGVEARVFCRP